MTQAPPCVELFIQGWHPARLNELMGGHWSKGHKLKKRDRVMVLAYSRMSVQAIGKRQVELTIVLRKGQRGGDVDAYLKSALDALKQAVMILDDNRQGVELLPTRYDREAGDGWGTWIRLWDLD